MAIFSNGFMHGRRPQAGKEEDGVMDTATIVPAVEATSRDAPSSIDRASDTPHDPFGLRVELVEDEDAFLSMGPVWNRLVDEARVDHPFLRHEWVRSWWECFQPDGKLHILVVMEGAEPIAIAPLMFDQGRVYGCAVRRLRGIANV